MIVSVCRTWLCLPVLSKAGSERLKATGESVGGRDVGRLLDESYTHMNLRRAIIAKTTSHNVCRPSQAFGPGPCQESLSEGNARKETQAQGSGS